MGRCENVDVACSRDDVVPKWSTLYIVALIV